MAQPDNNLMNMSMTRSIYIGIDKTAEVLKRKEAAEKELLARREAKMKEQAERIERARNQKEADLRERIRERQQREMERQKAALDRRCAQLDKLNAKKEEILQKNHQKASRVAANRQQNKPVFAFGSSTPRELCFLEKGGQQKRSNQALSTNSRGSASPQQNLRSEPPTARVPSRFTTSHYRGEKPIPSSNAMTRSVFGSLTSSTSANNNKQATSPRRKPSAVKKQTRSPLSSTTSTKSAPQPLMTQSLYSSKPLQNGSPKSAPSKAKTPEVSKNNTDIDPRQQRRPVMRRKVEDKAKVLKSPVAGTSATISTHFQQPTIDFNMTMEKTFEEDIVVQKQNVVPAFEPDQLPKDNLDLGVNKMGCSNSIPIDEVKSPNLHDSSDEFNKTYLASSSGPYTSLHDQMEEVLEHSPTEDRNRESIMSDKTLVLFRVDKDDSLNIVDTTDATLVPSTEEQRPPSYNRISLDESEVISPKPTIPPVQIPPILEEKRNQRRQQLNEILQKIRPENGASPQTPTIHHSSSNGLAKNDNMFSDTMTSPNIAVANPLMTKMSDRTALAEFLQERRRAMNKSMQESNGGDGQPQLPGQVSATIMAKNPPVNAVFHSEEKNETNGHNSQHDNYKSIRTPPEDPHMNNGHGNEEMHPPEPTLINFG
uniref:Uncharacterized protein n=1 Tax=Meloidogyne enterolobii TaxID=390850 RepID=A0A6V7UZM1_MELEN|nr:unnamed protein product [Meloidogyne enterolobii]